MDLTSRFAQNGPVRMHYLAVGAGSPVVLLHGFPDYSGGWMRLVPSLAERHRVLIPDLRGFNLSSAPSDVASYAMPVLVNDVLAVLAAEGIERAAIVGHDWGAAVAYWLAMRAPAAVSQLVALSMPHPRSYLRAAAAAGGPPAYVRSLIEPGSEGRLDLQQLAQHEPDGAARADLIEALGRSSATGMMNYYRANIPLGSMPDLGYLPKIQVPTLGIFAADDRYLPPGAFDRLHEEVSAVTTLVALPRGGHFIQRRAAPFILARLVDFLAAGP